MRILLLGLAGAGKTTLGVELSRIQDLPLVRLDAFRESHGDGTIAGDYLARSLFLRACGTLREGLFEFSGAGFHRVSVRQAFREGSGPLLTVWVDTPHEERHRRLAKRGGRVPLPDWGLAPDANQEAMRDKLVVDLEMGFWASQPGWHAERVDGQQPVQANVERVCGLLTRWSAP